MSNPNPARMSAGTPDGGRFAPSGRTEAEIDLPESGPTAEDRAQFAAIYRNAQIAADATARFELGSAKMLAQGVLRQWPSARYLELTESDQGTGSQFPGRVLASTDPRDELAQLEDEELANGANPEELAMNLTTDGAWTEYTAPSSAAGGQTLLDLHAAAAIGEPTTTGNSAAQEGVREIDALKEPGWSVTVQDENTVQLADEEEDYYITREGDSYVLMAQGSDQQEHYSSWVGAARGLSAVAGPAVLATATESR